MKVTKSKVSVALLACLMVVMALLMAFPMVSSAAIVVTGENWYGTTYVGTDTFYGVSVNAFEAGTNARVGFNIQNTFDYDVNIKAVTVKFDWGAAYNATSFPPTLAVGQGGTVLFDFAVPSTDGINATVHGYELKVAYESADAPAIVTSAVASDTGTGVANQVVNLASTPVEPGSVAVYVNGGLWTSGFSQDLYLNRVTFTTAVPLGQNITIYYKYGELLFAGNGSLKTGYLDHFPAASVDAPFIRDSISLQSNSVAADGYAVNLDTGRVALTAATAPGGWQSVYVSYTYYPTWTSTGTNIAVYSADQADAQALNVQLTNMNNNTPSTWLPFTTVGDQAQQESDVLKAQADAKYVAGDFAGAETDYQSAIDKLNEARTANATVSTTAETGILGLLDGADKVVNAYGSKLKGEAAMDKNVGIFYIMLGVAVLLAGIATIIWSFSRYVAAKGPRQQ
jgi:hypothetical protein